MRQLEAVGWVVTRSAGSRTAQDLMASRATRGLTAVLLVQCKLAGKISPLEKADLLAKAEQAGAAAILVSRYGWFRILPDGSKTEWQPNT